jgi:hypothetical protein
VVVKTKRIRNKRQKNAPPQTRKSQKVITLSLSISLASLSLFAPASPPPVLNEAAVAGGARRHDGHKAALISRGALGELGRRIEVMTDVGPRRQRIPGAGGGGRWRSGDRWERSHGGEKLIAE